MSGYVVQSATFAGTFTSGTVTLLGATRAGNTLVALAAVRNATTSGSISSVTLGGVADNFGQVSSFTSSGTASTVRLFWWLDPLCAGGQTQVAFTSAGGVGNEALSLAVLEVGGMVPLPANPQAIDAATFGTYSNLTSGWNSGTVKTNRAPAIWTAISSAIGSITATTAGDPQYPWVNLPVITGGSVSTTTVFSYQLVPTAGTVVYAGTFNFSGGVAGLTGVTTFPCIAAAPVLPDYMAGAGVQQGDMASLVTSPLGFAQQRTVFRAAQLNTSSTIPAGPGTQIATIGYDTIFEDPYQGWVPSQSKWVMPFSGLYMATYSVSVGSVTADTIINAGPGLSPGNINGGLPTSGNVMPAAGGIVQGQNWIGGIAGQGAVSVRATSNSATPVATSTNPGSTLEIIWLGFTVAGS